MNYTKQQLEKMMKRNGGSLYLSGTGITREEKAKVKRLSNGNEQAGNSIVVDVLMAIFKKLL